MEMSEVSNDAQLEQVQTELTPEIIAALETLRNAGFAVCAFTPTELSGADVRHVEDRLCEYGWDVIECLTDE